MNHVYQYDAHRFTTESFYLDIFLFESTKTFLNDALIPGQISRIPVAVYG